MGMLHSKCFKTFLKCAWFSYFTLRSLCLSQISCLRGFWREKNTSVTRKAAAFDITHLSISKPPGGTCEYLYSNRENQTIRIMCKSVLLLSHQAITHFSTWFGVIVYMFLLCEATTFSHTCGEIWIYWTTGVNFYTCIPAAAIMLP